MYGSVGIAQQVHGYRVALIGSLGQLRHGLFTVGLNAEAEVIARAEQLLH